MSQTARPDITDQALSLAQRLPGQVRRISVRHGDSQVEPRLEERTQEPQAGVHVVPAPLVGTFYRAPSPGAPPFVEVGARVRAGQTLAIVEAMKLMNPIVCEVDGQVLELPVADGESVQFGQSLVCIAAADPSDALQAG
jgi:acetyl-CoA carboxylase biotin carboxyl carrier protein